MRNSDFDINRLSEYKEDNRLEVKKASGGLPHSIWATYSSFANSEGGLIVLGVEEDKKHQLHVVGGGVSDPRNATLMKMFSLIGIGDRAGMGIPNMIDIWQRLTGYTPIYVSQFSPDRTTMSMQIKAIGDKSATSSPIGDKSGDNSTVGQKLDTIIEYRQMHQNVTVSEMADVLSIKASRTRDYLRMLVERGLLIANGANKNRTYSLKRK